MNFFGHAAVACEHSDEPRFLLGAMLPDLCSMAGLRYEKLLDDQLARGVELHHETDRRFHASAPFLSLCTSALHTLEGSGVGRATARAVGHVGSELLLDGLLSHDARARAAYGRTLEVALDQRLSEAVVWKRDDRPTDLHAVLGRLANAPVPEGYRSPAFVCDRLEFILSRRPRLALKPGDREPVRDWLTTAAERLGREADALLEAVR